MWFMIAHEEKAVKAAAAYQLERLSLLHQNSFLPSIAQQTRALPWGGVCGGRRRYAVDLWYFGLEIVTESGCFRFCRYGFRGILGQRPGAGLLPPPTSSSSTSTSFFPQNHEQHCHYLQ